MMSLLALMYHRARSGPYGNTPAMLDAHFAHIAANYACVLPGDNLDPDRLNVCLTFDDASYDFYAVVFPLLAKHNLCAVLAVPPVVVSERVDLEPHIRLLVESDFSDGAGYCTWTELREIARSGLVAIAAHGYTHRPLDGSDVDLHTEIVSSKLLLSARLGCPVDSFVFPYGRFSPRALQLVQQHYAHAFRIGGADNLNWDRPLLYRVGADRLPSPTAPFSQPKRLGQRARRYWNRLRGR
ncbi:MAG: polysaccharide deacetylase family protein [Verrucomicrobia bacterium]|nr:polysaccharide deacetylase family protein [Verrucomicrobiota bacterium]